MQRFTHRRENSCAINAPNLWITLPGYNPSAPAGVITTSTNEDFGNNTDRVYWTKVAISLAQLDTDQPFVSVVRVWLQHCGTDRSHVNEEQCMYELQGMNQGY